MQFRTGVQALFDPLEEIMLRSAIEGAAAFRRTRERLITLLRTPNAAFLVPWPGLSRLSLMRVVSGITFAERCRGRLPFGWKAEIQVARDAYLLMPWWVYYPRRLWDYRWKLVVLFVRAGFWSIPQEGGYFRDGRWTWEFWRTLDARWTRAKYRQTFGEPCSVAVPNEWRLIPRSRWERFGWWLEARTSTGVWS